MRLNTSLKLQTPRDQSKRVFNSVRWLYQTKLVIVDTTTAPAVEVFVNVFIDFEGFFFLDLLRNTFVWHLFFFSII